MRMQERGVSEISNGADRETGQDGRRRREEEEQERRLRPAFFSIYSSTARFASGARWVNLIPYRVSANPRDCFIFLTTSALALISAVAGRKNYHLIELSHRGSPGSRRVNAACKLTAENLCKLFGSPERPAVCISHQASDEFCG